MKKTTIIITLFLIVAMATSVLGAPIHGATICGVNYDCGDDDLVCPLDYAPTGDVCDVCDPQCSGSCGVVDCNVTTLDIDPTQTPTYGHDIVNLETTSLGVCNREVTDITVKVTSTGTCGITELSAINIYNWTGGTQVILGEWWYPGEIPNNCLDETVTASGDLDAASITYSDGTTVTAGATGSFTFHDGTGGSDRCDQGSECVTLETCWVTLQGKITKSEGGNLEGATITLHSIENNQNNEIYAYDTTTDVNGDYEINDIIACDEDIKYQYIASEYYRAPIIKEVEYMNPGDGNPMVHSENHPMQLSQSTCEADCTREGYPVCDRTCNGWKGCVFANPTTMNECDPSNDPYDGYVAGSVKMISGNELRCCEGNIISPTTKYKPKVFVDAENVIKSSRVVIVGGEQLEMHLVVFE